jgi:antirestriction protein ArdC
MPRNASTQRGYSGINVLILWGEQQMEHELAMTRGSPLQSSKGLEK